MLLPRTWLVQARSVKGLTQKDLANKVGLTAATICDYESGKVTPTIQNAKRVGEELGFDYLQFYSDELIIKPTA